MSTEENDILAENCERDRIELFARLASIETKIEGIENSAERAIRCGESAMNRADDALTRRFEQVNEFRAAMEDQTRQYITRGEFQWAIGSVILMLVGVIIRMLTS